MHCFNYVGMQLTCACDIDASLPCKCQSVSHANFIPFFILPIGQFCTHWSMTSKTNYKQDYYNNNWDCMDQNITELICVYVLYMFMQSKMWCNVCIYITNNWISHCFVLFALYNLCIVLEFYSFMVAIAIMIIHV